MIVPNFTKFSIAPCLMSKTATTYQMYFGRNIEVLTRKVGSLDFCKFVKEHVVPQFESITITEGKGCWKGKLEDVFIVTIITENYEDGIAIHNIAETYKKQFYQDAVLVNTFTSFPNLV